jgi:hypothetical protein
MIRQFVAAGIAITLASSLFASAPAQSPTSARNTFRVLQWNVSDSAWVKAEPATRAVLHYANPDIVMLVEVHKYMTAPEVKRMMSGMRGSDDTTWFISYREGAGGEHTAIASRTPLTEVAELQSITLPQSGPRAARIAQPDSEKAKAPAPTAVSIAGAVARIGSKAVLIVPMHFTCCGSFGTWREYRRQEDALLIRERLRAALSHIKVDAIVAGGDMNLVSGRVALDTLLSSVNARPLGPMRRADALHIDGWTDWTWDGTGTPFNGGRLDNMIYSSGTLRVTAARILDTADMPADSLRAHSLEAGMSQAINRHRPVVVDFEFVGGK